MKVMTLLTAIALTLMLTLAMPAEAQFNVVKAEAYEVNANTLRVPRSKTASIGFKPCDDCEYMTRRVTAETRWKVNHEPVSLDDFRRVLARADRDKAFITVLHHLESDLITEVSVTIF